MARLRNGKCVAEKEEGVVEPVKKRKRGRARNAVANQNKDEEEELLENRGDNVSDEVGGKRKKVEEVVNVKLRRKVVEKGKKTLNQNQEKNVEKINKHDPKVASSFSFFFSCF